MLLRERHGQDEAADGKEERYANASGSCCVKEDAQEAIQRLASLRRNEPVRMEGHDQNDGEEPESLELANDAPTRRNAREPRAKQLRERMRPLSRPPLKLGVAESALRVPRAVNAVD